MRIIILKYKEIHNVSEIAKQSVINREPDSGSGVKIYALRDSGMHVWTGY